MFITDVKQISVQSIYFVVNPIWFGNKTTSNVEGREWIACKYAAKGVHKSNRNSSQATFPRNRNRLQSFRYFCMQYDFAGKGHATFAANEVRHMGLGQCNSNACVFQLES